MLFYIIRLSVTTKEYKKILLALQKAALAPRNIEDT